MKKLFVLSVVLIFVSCSNSNMGTANRVSDPASFEIRPLTECVPRGGLPNFFKKLESEAPEVNIAYFGGSISCQSGYRVLSREYFSKKYPKTRINEIFAAIGGTGSDLGVYRCAHDVLRGKPDLVFVEFAVNDSGTETISIRRNMEGIVRQIWSSSPKTDIIFVYSVMESFQQNMLDGKAERSVSIMEDIADYYSIPSVNFGAGLVPLIENGTLVLKSPSEPVNSDGTISFSKDGVHPHVNTGHVLYEKALERSWPLIKVCGKACAHKLGPPMVEDCREKVETVGFEDKRIKLTGSYIKNSASDSVTAEFLQFSDDFYTLEPGCVVSFRFKGSSAAIYDLIGPQSASLDVTVDGVKRQCIRFDGYSTYHRLALLELCNNLDPELIHSVSIIVSESAPDKRDILFEDNKPDYDANKEKYAPLHYYAGCIFIAGKLVE